MQVTAGDVAWTVSEKALASLRTIFGKCDQAFVAELLSNARPSDSGRRGAEKWRTGRRFRRLGLIVVPYASGTGQSLTAIIR